MQTQVLPSVSEALEGHVWIHVSEYGGIRFLRHFKGGELEDAGLLPPEMMPDWIQSYFASIDIWLGDLEVAVDVSVEYSGCVFPDNVLVANEEGAEIETHWSLFGQEYW